MQCMAMANEAHPRRSDALAMGLFGLAVGAFTVGLAQLGEIPERNHIEIPIIVFVCGGLMPFLAGMAMFRSREPYWGIALTTYGLFSIAACMVELVSASIGVQRSPILYGQLNVVYFICSAVVVYLTAYRGTTICLLFFVIAATSLLSVLASLGLLTETLPGIGHLVVGLMALYHAVGSVTVSFTGHELVPLGPPLLPRRASDSNPEPSP